MKVYIVRESWGYYENYREVIGGVYDSLDKAKAKMEALHKHLDLLESHTEKEILEIRDEAKSYITNNYANRDFDTQLSEERKYIESRYKGLDYDLFRDYIYHIAMEFSQAIIEECELK